MTAVKKKFISVLLGITMLLAGFALLVSCGKTGKAEDLKVTFMVEDDEMSEWREYSEVVAENGEVELPSVSRRYYTFANWYEDKDFTVGPFTGKNIKNSVTVYARFIPVEVNVTINGADQGTHNLVDVVNGTYNPGEGLEFDGWYTNANCTTPWDNVTETNDLYARSVARITFNDGYQDVYTTTVTPGSVYVSPVTHEAQTEAGETSTIEKAFIWRNYMSARDISYVDENGEVFDFDEPITRNTVITVRWRSPFLKYQTNPDTKKLCVTMYGNEGTFDDTKGTARIGKVPVISILGEITFDQDGDGVAETYQVESVRPEQAILNNASIQKVIIGEGIVSVQSLISSAASGVTEIVLPSTLKVIQNCFNNLNKLTNITIPDGVEVIMGSFWANTAAAYNYYATYNKGNEYPFEIVIPDSVKNLSMVPNNLKFSHTKETAQAGDFYKDGKRIYKIDDREGHVGDLVLISDMTDASVIDVPEGVKGIQVGTYFNRTLEYLNFPSTFSYVSYNEDVSKYPAAAFQYSTGTFLFDSRYANDPLGNIPPTAYSIFSGMESITLLNFKQTGYPAGLPASAFIGDTTGNATYSEELYEFCDSTSLRDKVVYTGENDTPSVTVNYVNKLTGETYRVTFGKTKNQNLTVIEILEKLDEQNGTALKASYDGNQLALITVKSFGADYDLTASLTTNVYLTATFNYVGNGGYTAVDNGDGTAKITGYNAETVYVAGDSLKMVMIPETVTIDGNALNVTKIDAEAFAYNTDIGYVSLPSTLKEVGDKAFYNCSSLKVLDMSACKLKKIGVSAFEGTAVKTVVLALSDLEEVGAYAFKTNTLTEFTPAAGEENRALTTKENLKAGEFFLAYGKVFETQVKYHESALGLYSYVSKSTVGEGDSAYTVWDVKFVASAGGYNAFKLNDYMVTPVYLGNVDDESNIVRYEVMEGSYYFLTTSSAIYFQSVSRIHANAFTDSETDSLGMTCYSPKYMGCASTSMSVLSDLVHDTNCASMFEEGWYDGYTDDGIGAVDLYDM